ncbi:MAG: hypothetical protein KDG89_06805 [Geminicoccaceae bacterium]|nr:hypothetical protein [Geminicoccaceae bacterium]
MADVVYHASPTLARFHRNDSRFRVVRGPVGSGKTTAMCWEIWRRAHAQPKGDDGVRRSRWLVSRSTYRELKDTTLKSWLQWFGPHRTGGRMRWDDTTFELETGDVHLEVIGRSLASEADVGKLLSLELTGAWLNEAREFPLALVNRLAERVGRFPPAGSTGAGWVGIVMDTNPADEDAWLTRFELEPPKGWAFFVQPPGLIRLEDGGLVTNPGAENLAYLERGYYEANLEAMTLDEVRVYRMNEPGFLVEGQPYVEGFHEGVHVRDGMAPMQDVLHLGLDIGGGTLTPGCVWLQRSPRGVFMVFDAGICEGMGAERLADHLAASIADLSPWHAARPDMVRILADPAGVTRDPIFEVTALDHLKRRLGWRFDTAPTQDIRLRIGAVQGPIRRLVDGVPGLVVHPRARDLVKGLKGGWHFPKVTAHGIPRFGDKPAKNRWSHVMDALGYALLCLGELKAQAGRDAGPRRTVRRHTHAITGRLLG